MRSRWLRGNSSSWQVTPPPTPQSSCAPDAAAAATAAAAAASGAPPADEAAVHAAAATQSPSQLRATHDTRLSCSADQCSSVQYSTVQCSTVKCSTVQYNSAPVLHHQTAATTLLPQSRLQRQQHQLQPQNVRTGLRRHDAAAMRWPDMLSAAVRGALSAQGHQRLRGGCQLLLLLDLLVQEVRPQAAAGQQPAWTANQVGEDKRAEGQGGGGRGCAAVQ